MNILAQFNKKKQKRKLEIKSYDEGQLDTLSSTFDGGTLGRII